MKVGNQYIKGIDLHPSNPEVLIIIDQRFLPHKLVFKELHTLEDVLVAIRDMLIRGAPLIGVTAGYGIYLACLEARNKPDFDEHIRQSAILLKNTRPTAVDLFKAIDSQLEIIQKGMSTEEKVRLAFDNANIISADTLDKCRKIGLFGLDIIKKLSKRKKGEPVQILTHCNAGWLATVDFGTATAPIYLAHDLGIPLHIWVDETRPRNQGASLTAWELLNHGVPHTVIADNTGGYLMQQGMVDMVIVGTDRTTRQGDVANKIGTYLKALAAKDNHIPFYVAAPSSSIDFHLKDGITEIPIETRSADEVKYIEGLYNDQVVKVLLTPKDSPAVNYGFDITPARLVTGIITERGICRANEKSLLALFPEKKIEIDKL